MKDYYKILGVPNTATQEEIKNAYRSLVKKYHPDINPDASAVSIIQDINEAYEVLSNLTSRQKYDAKLRQESKTTTTPSQHTKQHTPYSSYTKTREESENDFDEWLKIYLKNLRTKYKGYYYNDDFAEKIIDIVSSIYGNIMNYNTKTNTNDSDLKNIITKHYKYK